MILSMYGNSWSNMWPHYFITLLEKIMKIKVAQRYYKHIKIQWVTNNRNHSTPLKKRKEERTN